jgi:uncharacterized protein YyaL (SSP411 family)
LAATALLRLAALAGREDLEAAAIRALESARGVLERYPTAAGQSLIAVDFAMGPRREAVVVEGSDAAGFASVMDEIGRRFRPGMVVAPVSAGAGEARHALPLLEGRTARDGVVTCYFCEGMACSAPAVGREAAIAELDGAG